MTSVACVQTSWCRTARVCHAVVAFRYEGSTVPNSSEQAIRPHKHKLKVSGLVNEVARHVDFHSLKLSVVAIQVSFDFLVRLRWIDLVLQSRVKVT
jgi:hypothetical protein